MKQWPRLLRFFHLLKSYPSVFLTINILAIAGIISIGVLLFFEYYLPSSTHHGESLTVPDLRGLSVAEARELLGHDDLRLAVGDSAFRAGVPVGHILSQSPAPLSQVKIGRRIYLTLNQVNAPLVRIPNILGSSLQNAEQLLQSVQLRIGEVAYVPHPQSGRVLKVGLDSILVDDPKALFGMQAPQNTALKLLVGDGMGEVTVRMPRLVGRPADEAEVHLLGIGLHVSQLHWEVSFAKPAGIVLKQKPYYGEKLRKGQGVEIWVSSVGY